MFGSDVGYARNYHKKVVANENGQLEVSYLDEKNNIIANALAGESPKSLEKLPADQRKSLTIEADILSNRQRHKTSSVTAAKNIAVTTEAQVIASTIP
ncbi:MAG: hypothetical protein U5L09_15095 [Bacteroidales bacterium]|nr:hypothetical protein [Bacteroidales bacterium]